MPAAPAASNPETRVIAWRPFNEDRRFLPVHRDRQQVANQPRSDSAALPIRADAQRAQHKNLNQGVRSVEPASRCKDMADHLIALQGNPRQPGPPRGARPKRINEVRDHGLTGKSSGYHTMDARRVTSKLGTDNGGAHQATVSASGEGRTFLGADPPYCASPPTRSSAHA